MGLRCTDDSPKQWAVFLLPVYYRHQHIWLGRLKAKLPALPPTLTRTAKYFPGRPEEDAAHRGMRAHRQLLWWPTQLCLTHLNSWGVLHLDRQHLPIYLDVPAVEVTWREHRQVHKDSQKHHRQVLLLLPISHTERDGAYLPSEGPTLRLIFPRSIVILLLGAWGLWWFMVLLAAWALTHPQFEACHVARCNL